jgi:hypothetical protein
VQGKKEREAVGKNGQETWKGTISYARTKGTLVPYKKGTGKMVEKAMGRIARSSR